MTEPIKAGDPVMIWRWPHEHTDPDMPIGKPLTVKELSDCDTRCSRCGTRADGPTASFVGEDDDYYLPLSWLKKLPPFEEDEDESTMKSKPLFRGLPVPEKGREILRVARPKRSREEANQQEALFTWAKLNEWKYPELKLLRADAAGGRRDLNTAVAMMRAGLKAGWPDVGLYVSRMDQGRFIPMLFIEMKSADGRLSDKQKEVFPMLEAMGYRIAICRTWEQARDAILSYLALPKVPEMVMV